MGVAGSLVDGHGGLASRLGDVLEQDASLLTADPAAGTGMWSWPRGGPEPRRKNQAAKLIRAVTLEEMRSRIYP